MDNGLDIEAACLVAVLHAALNARPARLAESLECFLVLAHAAAPAAELRRCVRRLLAAHDSAPDWMVANRMREWLALPGRRQFVIGQPDYPPLLAQIDGPPPVLLVVGASEVLQMPQIAVVGSRRATPAAREIAYGLAGELVRAGLTVTSGLAAGIDRAAHEGALEGGGLTLAVFGCGVDLVYPRTHGGLAARIREQGLLVSEFPLGTPPLAGHFPRRNRIISGLALGTVVVEAALTSGSLVTARHALDQGREVFAVPGMVRNPLARGCHALLRDGATLTERGADILNALPGFSVRAAASDCFDEARRLDAALGSMPRDARRVYEASDFEPRGIDRITAECGLTASEVSSILTALEMQGVVRAVGGGSYVRTGKIPA